MPSIVPGYEYDIFISYRHKDNKYDGWVTDFVDNLSRELESTFKQDVSIYFDRNAHDGLHETDDVDGSLGPKLKSLILIPIVSQTYCDPESFAWRKELLTFLQLASSDALGLKVRNARGNVTSRVLPVRIHDLNPDDQKLFEQVTGGPFRPIDFVYSNNGVNRALRSNEDAPKDNHNRTYYRDQISKIAGAIKDMIGGLPTENSLTIQNSLTSENPKQRTASKVNTKWIIAVAVVLTLLVATVFFSLQRKDTTDGTTSPLPVAKTLAVLPFVDMSKGQDQEYFADGITEEILNVLANIPGLKVAARTTAFSFKGKNEDVREIGKKLNVSYVMEGSVRKDGDNLRITVQLINAETGEHVVSETYDHKMTNIFDVQDEIAHRVVAGLKLAQFSSSFVRPLNSKPELYDAWMEANYYYGQGTQTGDEKAFEIVKRTYKSDSTDARITGLYAMLISVKTAYDRTSSPAAIDREMREAKRLIYKAIDFDRNLPLSYIYASSIELGNLNFQAAARHVEKAAELNPGNVNVLQEKANIFILNGRFKEAEEVLKTCLLISSNMHSLIYNLMSTALMGEYRYDEALTASRAAIRIDPSPTYYMQLATLYLAVNKPDSAAVSISLVGDEFLEEYYNIQILWAKGKRVESDSHFKKFIEQYHELCAIQIAEIYGFHGEVDKSMEWLEIAVKQKDPGLSELKFRPFFKRDDPRFLKIAREIGL